MSTTISVTKDSLRNFFSDSQKHPFLIPEYQRPYAWDHNQIETLFDDLKEFIENVSDDPQREYFLGAIVYYKNDNDQKEIIDGHQRIVSLLLLFRVIYKFLETADSNETIMHNKWLIEPFLWKKQPSGQPLDRSKILIKSEVISEQTNNVFHQILETGEADARATDLHSQNYLLLQNLYKEYCGTNSMAAAKFIDCLTDQVIVLPIQAESQDMALTIFSTLNDRGKPLSDADIFKAKIYKYLDDANKKSFVERWKALESRACDANESIEELFYSYMLYNRACDKNRGSTMTGVRKYFLDNNARRLREPGLIDNLERILNLWEVTNQFTTSNELVEIEDETWPLKNEILRLLDILASYPNDFWRHTVVTYYLLHGRRNDFDETFLHFLRKLPKICRESLLI